MAAILVSIRIRALKKHSHLNSGDLGPVMSQRPGLEPVP